MGLLAENPATLFIGQSVQYPSNALFKTLQNEDGSLIVPMQRRIEFPVAENLQMGYSIGLSLTGFLPVSIFPRMDFLILAMDALVNHLDKMPYGSFRPKVIIRTTVGARYPLHSGHQHTQNHTAALRLMLQTVEVLDLASKFDVFKSYKHALECDHSCLLVEHQDLYNP